MTKKTILIGVGVIALAVTGTLLLRGGTAAPEIDYKYAKVTKGEIVSSISATGQLVAFTSVDVKSKAGGEVTKLLVQEGQRVKKGDVIALIDPRDTRASFEQAQADVVSAEARVNSATTNASLERENSITSVRDAEIAVATAKIRLQRAEENAKAQPGLSGAELNSARAALATQQAAMRELELVTIPQARKDAEVALERTRVDFETADADYSRQRDLLAKGFVSQSVVDRASAALESAKAAYQSAQVRSRNLDAQLGAQLDTQRQRLKDAEAGLQRAQANQGQVPISQRNLDEARQAVEQAKVALERARDAKSQVKVREADVAAARASTVRSKVAMSNAKVQLESTEVVAPRDGVVTTKYLEEGTIIPPGTSTFSQGTSLVQISDITRMFVECQVDEADIAQVRVGQNARVILEAYPGRTLVGKVDRVNPAAVTANNITAIKVRVEVISQKGVELMPGMTATCEFLTLQIPDAMQVPSQAIKDEGGKSYVLVKGKDPKKPDKRDVEVGETGNDGTQILSGLKVGDEVVIAEIDLAQLREVQKKMLEAQQGGGLAGGAQGPGGRGGSRPSTGGGMGSGGGRPSGGGGGSR